jgi:glycosyltransferase involved in cell wall biosynthesis
MSSLASPAVSVIVPVYNRLGLLRATVQSLRQQSLTEAEFLLIDDRSSDDVAEFLHRLPQEDRRFRILRKPAGLPQGCQASRNIGLEQAASPYIVFLDSDDLLQPYCLQKRLAFLLAHPSIDIAVGNQASWDEKSGKFSWINIPNVNREDLDRFLSLAGPVDVPWVNGGCMIRAESLKTRSIRWRNEFHWDDVVFHLDCLMAGMRSEWMPRSETPDSLYRQHGGEHYGATLQTLEGRENKLKMFEWLFKMLQQTHKTTSERVACLKRSLFLTCIMPEVDLNMFSLATQICGKAEEWSLFSKTEMVQLELFIRLRGLTTRLHRIRYYLNKFARHRLLRDLFGTEKSTYCSIPVEHSGNLSFLSHSQFERVSRKT